ncbi:MAG TPA: Fe-S cluster assembly protein HesB, partial [Candidatus Polarisedimenticolia bacterium]|nr:Fe-S cluster assembly protein HesB [Candidatus Polarisedimenticolia bacterium]
MPHSISTPRDFSFKRTVLSHGWAELPPFSVDRDTWTLKRVLDLDQSPPVTVTINGTRRALLIRTSRPLGQRATKRVERQVRHMLRLDDDLRGFYRTMSTAPDFAWITEQGAGRLLRSPTVFEDLVKMICTTNCSWSLTEKMVKGLVQNLGREASDGGKTFPTPEAMARRPLRF